MVEGAGAVEQQSSGGVESRLEVHHRELVDTMESRFELPAELISRKVLDRTEYSDLRAINGVNQRNEFILKTLHDKSEKVIQDFIKSLDNTEQQQVASYLRGIDINSGDTFTVVFYGNAFSIE